MLQSEIKTSGSNFKELRLCLVLSVPFKEPNRSKSQISFCIKRPGKELASGKGHVSP